MTTLKFISVLTNNHFFHKNHSNGFYFSCVIQSLSAVCKVLSDNDRLRFKLCFYTKLLENLDSFKNYWRLLFFCITCIK